MAVQLQRWFYYMKSRPYIDRRTRALNGNWDWDSHFTTARSSTGKHETHGRTWRLWRSLRRQNLSSGNSRGCPFEVLKAYLSHLNPNSDALFQKTERPWLRLTSFIHGEESRTTSGAVTGFQGAPSSVPTQHPSGDQRTLLSRPMRTFSRQMG